MSKKINGISGAIEQPSVIERTPNRGLVTTRRWECSSAVYATALTALLDLAGWSWKRTNAVKPLVEATCGGDGIDHDVPIPQATDTWELVFEDTQKDFLEADHFLTNALEGPSGADHIKKLRAYMQDPDSYAAFTGGSVDSKASAEYLFKLWKAGFRSLEISQPIFRINRTCDIGYSVQWAYADVGKILRTPRMISDSQAPASFLVPLGTIDFPLYTDPVRTDGLSLAYGWKKYPPTQTLAAYEKLTIQQQYKFGLWDVNLYNVPLL